MGMEGMPPAPDQLTEEQKAEAMMVPTERELSSNREAFFAEAEKIGVKLAPHEMETIENKAGEILEIIVRSNGHELHLRNKALVAEGSSADNGYMGSELGGKLFERMLPLANAFNKLVKFDTPRNEGIRQFEVRDEAAKVLILDTGLAKLVEE